MNEELNRTCKDCENIEVIYYCRRLKATITEERNLSECPYSFNWQRGEALYTWYCPKCGNQVLNLTPPMECPECNTLLGRKNV